MSRATPIAKEVSRFAAAAAAAFAGTLLVAGCALTSRPASLPVITKPAPAGVRIGTATESPQASATAPTGKQLPITVESDGQMKSEGNDGPTSSILLPTSCGLTGSTVTAEGGYANGGFVPNVYNRYGDIIVLYVMTAASPGYAQGNQLGASGVSQSPVVGSHAPWHVSLSISPSVGRPQRCVVAAQPTHAGQFAP